MRLRLVATATLLVPLLLVASHAQEKKDGPDEQMKALLARKSTQRLSFAEPSQGWKPRPRDDAKPFLCDYDLPAAEGDPEPPRVNVLFFPVGFEDYRSKILG